MHIPKKLGTVDRRVTRVTTEKTPNRKNGNLNKSKALGGITEEDETAFDSAKQVKNNSNRQVSLNGVYDKLVSHEHLEDVSNTALKEFSGKRMGIFASIADHIKGLSGQEKISAIAETSILKCFESLCGNSASGKEIKDALKKSVDETRSWIYANYDGSDAKELFEILRHIDEKIQQLPNLSNSEINSAHLSIGDDKTAYRQFEDCAMEILSSVTQYCSKLIQKDCKEEEQLSRYGGKIGDKIFKTFSSQWIVPLTIDLFRKWEKDVVDLKDDQNKLSEYTANFLSHLLKILGKERAVLAQCSNTKNFQNYGLRLSEGGLLYDRAGCESRWGQWTKEFEDKINNLLQAAKRQPLYENTNIYDGEPKISINNCELSFFDRKEVADMAEYKDLDSNLSDRVGLLRYSGDQSSATFRFSYTRREKEEITVPEMICFHSQCQKEALDRAASYLIKALQSNDKNEIRESMGGVLFLMNHPSHFGAGQAAISEFITTAIAGFHDKNLKLIGRCAGDNRVPLDQGILLCSSIEEAKDFCLKNIDLIDSKENVSHQNLINSNLINSNFLV